MLVVDYLFVLYDDHRKVLSNFEVSRDLSIKKKGEYCQMNGD